MASNDSKRFYWLKLKEDFFKGHKTKIIKSLPNGSDYLLFYINLLCESVSHNGRLRFSETIPYNETMLSAITDTNVDTVRNAVKVLRDMELLEVMDDGTLYLTEVEKMIGSETGIAQRLREYRSKDTKELQTGYIVTKSIDIRDKSIEEDIYMTFPLKDGNEYELKSSSAKMFNDTFKNIDVYGELLKAKSWLISNPEKRKTSRGMMKFLNGWLSRVTPTQTKVAEKPKEEVVVIDEEELKKQQEELMSMFNSKC